MSPWLLPFKGTVTWDFYGYFLAWMDLYRPKREPLLVLNFKDVPSILGSNFKYWCVLYQTFLEILRISEKDWQPSTWFSNFSIFWVSGSLRNAAKGINTSRRFYESQRMFSNNISVSIRQLSILLRDSTNLREGLVWSEPKLKIVAKNRRRFKKILKP